MSTVVKVRNSDVTTYLVEGSLQPGIHDLYAHTRICQFSLKNGAINALGPTSGFTASLSGYSAYCQLPALPDVGTVHGTNLVKNAACASGGGGWTFNANGSATYQVDSTAASGSRIALTSGAQSGGGTINYEDITIEAGRVYSLAAQMMGDGTHFVGAEVQWKDAGGTTISTVQIPAVSAATWTESPLANQTTPGNARTARIVPYNASGAGTVYFSAVRMKQQTTAPAAWSSADQPYFQINRGLSVYEATTNLAADGDMEAVGTASYIAGNSTIAKDPTHFAGTQSLKVTTLLAGGFWNQNSSLAAGQAITVSLRVLGGDAGTSLQLYSQPSHTQIGATQSNPNTTTWNALRVSGVIAGGDTGYQIAGVAGTGIGVVAYFDNLGVENKAYDTLNSDATGQAYTTGTRAASSDTLPLPTGFNISAFALVGAVRLDQAGTGTSRYLFELYKTASDNFIVYIGSSGGLAAQKTVGGLGAATAVGGSPSVGDTLAWGLKFDGSVMRLFWSINGAAVSSNAGAADTSVPATPVVPYVGGNGAGGNIQDCTTGVVRFLAGGLTDAQVGTVVQNPYQAATAADLAIWTMDGAMSGITRGIPNGPDADDYVSITRTDGSTLRFSGLSKIPDTSQNSDIRTGVEYAIAGQGWEALLDTVLITGDIVIAANTVDAALLSTVLTTYFTPIATSVTHYLYPARTDLQAQTIPANTMTLRSFLDWLSTQAGGTPWWLDLAKGVHYNDQEQLAPYILSDAPSGSSAKTAFQSLLRTRDTVGRRTSVTVNDGNGNSYTATDDEQTAYLNGRVADEPGAAGTRTPTPINVVDTKLTTATDLERRAWEILRMNKDRTIWTALTFADGFDIGQYVDVISAQYGVTDDTGAAVGPNPFLEVQEFTVSSATEDLDTSIGRLLITKVTPISQGRDKWAYQLEMGDPQQVMSALLSRGQQT